MTAFLLVAAGVLGLLIGSFLNVVAYRVPNGMSIVSPGSACPGCHNEIAARDNIPLVSWLLLRARCRHCDMHIPARYPIVEGLTGLAFVLAALPFASRVATPTDPRVTAASALELVAFLYLAAISVVLAVIDLDVRRLPSSIVLPSYVVGAALLVPAAVLRENPGALLVAAVGGAGAYLFYWLLTLYKNGAGMGLGDVKLAGVLGLFLGYLGIAQLTVGVAAGFAIGGVLGIALMLLGRRSWASKLSFGPLMLIGAWVGVFAGQPLADAYLHLTGLA